MKGVQDTVGRLEMIEAIVFGSALVAMAAAGTALIRFSLRPLGRVTATASEVSDLPLESGEVVLPHRVPQADPRTEVGRLGRAFNQMLGHVEASLATRQASEAKLRRFVADASHELRTPLAGIRAYTELALRTSDVRVAGPGHRWVLDLPADPVVVTGDEHRLHQVLANLLSNAGTHTPEGTTITVSLSANGAGGQHDHADLAVHDDGPGIPAELQEHIWERFGRADSTRSRTAGSTRLGLAIVRAVVSAHGGRLGLTSGPGSATFLISLPAGPPGRDG